MGNGPWSLLFGLGAGFLVSISSGCGGGNSGGTPPTTYTLEAAGGTFNVSSVQNLGTLVVWKIRSNTGAVPTAAYEMRITGPTGWNNNQPLTLQVPADSTPDPIGLVFRGPIVTVSGTYTATLSIEGKTVTDTFTIDANQRQSSSSLVSVGTASAAAVNATWTAADGAQSSLVTINNSLDGTFIWQLFTASNTASLNPTPTLDASQQFQLRVYSFSANLTGDNPTLPAQVNMARASTLLSLTTPTPASNIRILRPADFSGGQASVTLNNVRSDESIAVIPVHATQSSEDGQSYTISSTGVTPQTMPTVANLEATHEADHHDHHLEHLQRQDQIVEKLLARGVRPGEPSGVSAQAFDKCPGPYVVSTVQCNFWIYQPDGTYIQRPTTLRFISESAYWFVDNQDISDLSNSELASLANIYEQSLLPSNRRYFGDSRDIDGNGKVTMVFSREVYKYALGFVNAAVDFFPDDQTVSTGDRSNEADVLYIATPSSIGGIRSTTLNLEMPGIIVHELKHLITASIRSRNLPQRGFYDEFWIEEGSAVAAMEFGFNMTRRDQYAQTQSQIALPTPQAFRMQTINPTAGQERASAYGYSFLFLWRQGERVGHEQFWKSLITGPNRGIANLEAVTGRSMSEMMLDFAQTLLFTNTNLIQSNPFDYQSLNLRDGTWRNLGYLPLQNTTQTVRSMLYLLGKGNGGNSTITIRSTSTTPHAIVARFNGSLPWSIVDGISGTVTVPAGNSVTDVIVTACEIVSDSSRCGPGTQSARITASGTSANFSFARLSRGQYRILADKDIDGNGFRLVGDLYSCYNTDQRTCALVVPPATNINVSLVLLRATSAQSLTSDVDRGEMAGLIGTPVKAWLKESR